MLDRDNNVNNYGDHETTVTGTVTEKMTETVLITKISHGKNGMEN